jgi:hypothetical protein
MPILKKKLAKNVVKTEPGVDIDLKLEEQPDTSDSTKPIIVKKEQEKPIRSNSSKKAKLTEAQMSASILDAKKKANSSKNIVKNYGRTMVTFAISSMALPYISNKLKEENLQFKDFKDYLFLRKETMDGISSLRALLLVTDDDDETVASIKRVFRHSSEVFIKFFSVNWIFNSKLGDKPSYVKSRFKLLRRINDPEHFTYFKL